MAAISISGFTFCRNAVALDYPIVESIRSIPPIVDEYVVNVGRSDDGTLDLIRSIGDACGVGYVGDPGERNLKDGPRRRLAKSGGRIVHYGYVKDPTVLFLKKQYRASLRHEVLLEPQRFMSPHRPAICVCLP